jgi:hypothetical protein
VISIDRESSARSIASRSASSTMRNWPFVTSNPRTISSCVTSRSCAGHQRFCLIGVASSRCSSRNDTSDCRAAGFVAGARPTGIETRPKLRDPFQVVRMVKGYSTESARVARDADQLDSRWNGRSLPG